MAWIGDDASRRHVGRSGGRPGRRAGGARLRRRALAHHRHRAGADRAGPGRRRQPGRGAGPGRAARPAPRRPAADRLRLGRDRLAGTAAADRGRAGPGQLRRRGLPVPHRRALGGGVLGADGRGRREWPAWPATGRPATWSPTPTTPPAGWRCPRSPPASGPNCNWPRCGARPAWAWWRCTRWPARRSPASRTCARCSDWPPRSCRPSTLTGVSCGPRPRRPSSAPAGPAATCSWTARSARTPPA